MFALIFWKVFLKGKTFTLIKVPPVAVVAVVIIMGRVVAVAMAVDVAAAVVMALGKGFGKNPEKSSPRRRGGIPSGFPMQKGVRIRVISIPLDALPAQKG